MKKKLLLATLLLITCLLVSGCEKNTSEFLKDQEALEKVETSDNTNDGKENQKDVTKGDTGNKETSKYANTPVPTDIPAPTNTPTPTDIPTPMNTPVPTNTPTLTPTNTPIAVSETDARAFEYTERRDDTIEILWLTSAGKKLTEIVIPKEINGFTVTRIGDSAFYGCDYLTSISIPNSITEIRDSAFSGCSGLTSISIPDSVTSIGDSAFNGCRGLTDINIPSSVTSIGKNAFFDCSGLTGIKVDANNPVYDSRNNCNAIIEKSSNKLILGCSNTVIPNNVASIGESAFCGCDRLTSISIPDSVTEIEDSAFRWCVCLTSVTLSNSLKRIEDELFCNCSCLTSISIPDSVTSIGWHAFSGCDSLTSIYVTKGSTAEQELRNLGYGDLLKYKD